MKHIISLVLFLTLSFQAQSQGVWGQPITPAPVSPRDFTALIGCIQQQTFTSSQMPLIQVAGLCGWFTCAQCAAIMNIFSFDDNKLQVVRYLSPHLVNPMECQPIMNALSFDTNRQKAWQLISSAGTYEPNNQE